MHWFAHSSSGEKFGWLSEPKEYTVRAPKGLWVGAMAQKNVLQPKRPGGGRGGSRKVTGNFSTICRRRSRVRAKLCIPGAPGATTGCNQKGLKPLQSAFSGFFRRFPKGYGPMPGGHCACRFLSILGVPVWNFSSNIGFIIPSLADQKFFKKAAPVAKSGINIVTFQYEPPHFIYVNFHVCHRY